MIEKKDPQVVEVSQVLAQAYCEGRRKPIGPEDPLVPLSQVIPKEAILWESDARRLLDSLFNRTSPDQVIVPSQI